MHARSVTERCRFLCSVKTVCEARPAFIRRFSEARQHRLQHGLIRRRLLAQRRRRSAAGALRRAGSSDFEYVAEMAPSAQTFLRASVAAGFTTSQAVHPGGASRPFSGVLALQTRGHSGLVLTFPGVSQQLLLKQTGPSLCAESVSKAAPQEVMSLGSLETSFLVNCITSRGRRCLTHPSGKHWRSVCLCSGRRTNALPL